MRACCPEARRGGFTLIEVLVALTIVAVTLTAALRGAMVLTSNAHEVEYKLYAARVAENRLLEMRFAHRQVGPGDSDFDCDQGGVRFRCSQHVTPTPNPLFRRIEVHVADGADGRDLAVLMALLPVN